MTRKKTHEFSAYTYIWARVITSLKITLVYANFSLIPHETEFRFTSMSINTSY